MATREMVITKASIKRIQIEVDYLNLPNWKNDGELFNSDRADFSIGAVQKMIEIHNIFSLEQVCLEYNDIEEKWELDTK